LDFPKYVSRLHSTETTLAVISCFSVEDRVISLYFIYFLWLFENLTKS